MNGQQGNRATATTSSTELYEAASSTLGAHPIGGVAIARTIVEARQRLADMLIFCDPQSPATADIVAFHRAVAVEDYDGTAGDIFTRVNAGTFGRTVIAHPLTTSTGADLRLMGSGERHVPDPSQRDHDHRLPPEPAARHRGYTRTWHHAYQLSPGDLWRPDPDRAPHTVTEVRRTRDRKTRLDRITLVDQYAQAFSYRSNELVPTAVHDPLIVHPFPPSPITRLPLRRRQRRPEVA